MYLPSLRRLRVFSPRLKYPAVAGSSLRSTARPIWGSPAGSPASSGRRAGRRSTSSLFGCFLVGSPWTVLGFWNAVIGLWLIHGPGDPVAEVAPFVAAGDSSEPVRLDTAILLTLRNEDPGAGAASACASSSRASMPRGSASVSPISSSATQMTRFWRSRRKRWRMRGRSKAARRTVWSIAAGPTMRLQGRQCARFLLALGLVLRIDASA